MSKPIVVPQSVRRKAGLTIVPKKPVWDDDATAMAEVMRIIEEEKKNPMSRQELRASISESFRSWRPFIFGVCWG
jgi:hypothetical protein